MIYELRIYRILPNRMPNMLARFEKVVEMWDRDWGIRQSGFWTVAIGDNSHDLYWMLKWESLAEREQKWNAFKVDPEWVALRTKSEEDGPIIEFWKSMILEPTSFSALK